MKLLRKSLIYLLIATVTFWTLFPVLYLFLTSVKPTQLFFAVPPRFIFRPDFGRYVQLFLQQSFDRFFVNSFVVAVFATALALIVGCACAFAFVEFRFRFRKFLFYLILLTRMYPPVTTLIPIFFAMAFLGLTDTRFALIISYASFQLPLVVWVMRNFFLEVPKEIKESAELDGCGPASLFFRIVLPLAAPGVMACAVLIFVLIWNEFLFALVLTSIRATTAPVALMTFIEVDDVIRWGPVSVLGFATLVPVFLILAVFHKFLVKGLMAGAFK